MGKVLRFTAAGILAAAVCAVVPGHAQQPAPAQAQPPAPNPDAPAGTPAADSQQPVFRAGINFVRVDVIVSDRSGNPVGDLKPEDFEITEEGQPQTVETFKLISLDGGRVAAVTQAPRQIRSDLDEETEAARDDVRLFAVFLDDYHVRLETGIQAREQIARFIETQLGPTDMVALMYPLQPMDSVRFTRNHDSIMRALQEFRGRKYNYQPQNDFEQRYANYPAEMVERIRNQVSLSAIKALTMRMGGLKEGRKALILVSEGYTNMLPPQLRDPVAAMPGVGNPSRFNPDAGAGSLNESRASFVANADLEMDLRNVYDTANRNNVSFYAVDPRGLATQEFDIGQNVLGSVDREYLSSTMNTLRTLAFNTDGRAIVNRNDLVGGMRQIVRDNSAYYLLGYNSTRTATDGKFHEIKVRVKRPGVQVRARRGYWAFTAADAERATAPPRPEPPKAVETAMNALNTPARSRLVRTWIGMDRGAAGKTRVTLVWEPMPKLAGAPARADDVPARMSLTAISPEGAPYFRGRLPETTPSGGTAGGAVSFEAAPGKVQMRLAVESAAAEVLDSELREMDIPDLSGTALGLGTPEVFRARTPRDLQLLKTDARATPTPAREFSRTERLLLRVPTFGSADPAPALTVQLLNRAGQPIARFAASPSAVRPENAHDVEVTLNPYPPGEYLLEITLAGSGEPLKELVGFRIIG